MMNRHSAFSLILLLSISSAYAMQPAAKASCATNPDKLIASAKRTAKDYNKNAVAFSNFQDLLKNAHVEYAKPIEETTIYELEWTKQDGKWVSEETSVVSTPAERPAISLQATLNLQQARTTQLAKDLSLKKEEKDLAAAAEAAKKQLADLEAKQKAVLAEAAKNKQELKLTAEEFARRKGAELTKIAGLRNTMKTNTTTINTLAQENTKLAADIKATENKIAALEKQAPKSGWFF